MLSKVRKSLTRQSKLILWLSVGFVLSLLVGLGTSLWGSEDLVSLFSKENPDQLAQIENIFGRFRESVRSGDPVVMATCMLIVFGINATGTIMRSISTIFILPLIGLVLLIILAVVLLPEVFLFLPKFFLPKVFGIAG